MLSAGSYRKPSFNKLLAVHATASPVCVTRACDVGIDVLCNRNQVWSCGMLLAAQYGCGMYDIVASLTCHVCCLPIAWLAVVQTPGILASR